MNNTIITIILGLMTVLAPFRLNLEPSFQLNTERVDHCTNKEVITRIELVQAISEGNYSINEISLSNGKGIRLNAQGSKDLKLMDTFCADDFQDNEFYNLNNEGN